MLILLSVSCNLGYICTPGRQYSTVRESGESIETRSGLAANVSRISSSSVRIDFVVANGPSINAHPVARLSLPVRSIPTIRGGFGASGHLFNRRVTSVVLSAWIETRLTTARLFDRGIRAPPVNIDATSSFTQLPPSFQT